MEGKRLTLYVDTSVIGGYFDIEFEKETKLLFDNIENENYNIMYSSVTEDELLNAPEQVRNLLNNIPKSLLKKVELTEEAVKLADEYISETWLAKQAVKIAFTLL